MRCDAAHAKVLALVRAFYTPVSSIGMLYMPMRGPFHEVALSVASHLPDYAGVVSLIVH